MNKNNLFLLDLIREPELFLTDIENEPYDAQSLLRFLTRKPK